MKILVDTTTIKKKCDDIEAELEYMDININALKNTVVNMGYKWGGKDYQYFIKNMDSFYENLYNMKDSITSYKDFIKGYISIIEKLNDYYANKKIDIK